MGKRAVTPQEQHRALVERFLGKIGTDEREIERLFGPPGESRDAFKDLYQAAIPKKERHALGEYYTPDWLAEHVLDELGFDGAPGRRLLDPACGSGTFLVAAINRVRRANRGLGREVLRDAVLRNVAGYDVNPLAVLTARANYRIAIRDLLPPGGEIDVPVELRDSILDPAPESFDFVAGNPPWISWDNLSEEYRERTKPLWRAYGLFSLTASAARHGGGKKDLAALMLYAAADRYLRDGGRLGFVITQTLFQSRGAGEGFRRFRVGEDGAPLRVWRVDDMVRLKPFGEAANWSGVIFLEKGRPTVYPVRYVRWNPQEVCEARPADTSRPESPWLVLPRGQVPPQTGPSDYTAHAGAYSGGANGVFWLRIAGRNGRSLVVENVTEKSKRAVQRVQAEIEPDLVYPLLRWRDVRRYRAVPSAHILLVQDPAKRKGIEPARLAITAPLTFAYLKRFQAALKERRSSSVRALMERGPFYSMYSVGPVTLARFKVVWRRMDRRINAAVAESVDDAWLGLRPVIPQETCAFIAAESAEEAHYLCALLNSDAVDALVRAHSVAGGKGFGSPGILEYLALRRFDPNSEEQRRLAEFSRQAHAEGAS